MRQWSLCLNTSTIRPASLLEKIDIAARTGYSAIELWTEELTRFEQSGRSLDELRRILEDSGLAVASVITLTPRNSSPMLSQGSSPPKYRS